jgi:hypothetical protein
MAQPLTVALPPGLILKDGATIRVTALDPATGDLVAGVDVANVTLEVDLLAGDLPVGPFLLVPGPRA